MVYRELSPCGLEAGHGSPESMIADIKPMTTTALITEENEVNVRQGGFGDDFLVIGGFFHVPYASIDDERVTRRPGSF